ncbi:MAG: helix-hairpin-helix domain-containing protein, partial [Planctomycetota bacterium]
MSTTEWQGGARVGAGAVLIYAVVALLVGWGDAARPAASEVARSTGELVDMNRADADRLRLLPEVGPGRAHRIVSEREANGAFGSVAELERVSGIGPAVRGGLEPW